MKKWKIHFFFRFLSGETDLDFCQYLVRLPQPLHLQSPFLAVFREDPGRLQPEPEWDFFRGGERSLLWTLAGLRDWDLSFLWVLQPSVLLEGTTELPLPWSRTILGGVTENSLQFLITWNITKCIHVQSYLLDTDHPRVPKTFPYSSSSECSAPKYLTWYHIWTKMQLCSESDQISDSRIAMWINLCVELEIIFSRIDVGYEEVEHLNKLFENKLMVANQ